MLFRSSIINISSIAALRPMGPLTVYSTTRAGITGLTTVLAGQVAASRIGVNCVAPGQVWTPMVAELLGPQARRQRQDAGLIQDEGTAWDIGWATVDLASDQARWVPGQETD